MLSFSVRVLWIKNKGTGYIMQSKQQRNKDSETHRGHMLSPNAVRWGKDRMKDFCCRPVVILFSLNVIKRNLPIYLEMGWSAAKQRQE